MIFRQRHSDNLPSTIRGVDPLVLRRCWFRSWRLLLLISILLSSVVLANWQGNARRQCNAISALRLRDAVIQYEDAKWPEWLANEFGPDYFRKVEVVIFRGEATDADLENLRDIAPLKRLSVGSTKITDTGTAHLRCLTALKILELSGAQITDAGVRNLAGLTALESLDLGGTNVTDRCIMDLKRLPELRSLALDRTQITDAGMQQISHLKSLEKLVLHRTSITDAGLVYLNGLNTLTSLDLTDTQVTAGGVARLKSSLPHCTVIFTK